jgi:hypothetical protein
MSPTSDKEALKQLREARKPWIEHAKESIKAQSALIKAIRKQIEGDAKTVPQIAAATGLSTSQVLLFISGLRKYGLAAEGAKDGDYYTYLLVSQKDASQRPDGEIQ